METQTKGHRKFWKPPSFEDFNVALPSKKIKLDNDEPIEEKFHEISSEPYEPKSISELAVHPKKVEEVRNWVKWSRNERAPILLVTGPAGCGKTTTLRVLANEDGFSVKEWINPVDKTEFKTEPVFQCEPFDKFNFSETKQTDKFEDFVYRSSRYKSLFDEKESMIILVKDIPNIFIWRPKLFHEFLEKYKNNGKSPIIFILTDDQNMNLTSSLFPNHIKIKFNITNIKFNPVNHSSLIKKLKSLSVAYCSEKVSSQFLDNIVKNSGGDLRSALSSLLLFLRTSQMNDQIKQKKEKKKYGIGCDNRPLSEKDSTFDFYRLIGRILYPKIKSEKVNCSNLKKIFVHDVQQLAESWNSSFLMVLHENYLHTSKKLKNVVKGADCFSFCDLMDHSQGLDEYVSLVAIITLMLENTEPKKAGFNPIKKSFKSEGNNSDVESEICRYQLSKRDFLLDVSPYLNILKVNSDLAGSENMCEDSDGYEDLIQIEEVDY